jgi:hypothetical protein
VESTRAAPPVAALWMETLTVWVVERPDQSQRRHRGSVREDCSIVSGEARAPAAGSTIEAQAAPSFS